MTGRSGRSDDQRLTTAISLPARPEKRPVERAASVQVGYRRTQQEFAVSTSDFDRTSGQSVGLTRPSSSAPTSMPSGLPRIINSWSLLHLQHSFCFQRSLVCCVDRLDPRPKVAQPSLLFSWLKGTIVAATLTAASSSTKNKDKERRPEMHQSKRGNDWHFRLKAHIGVDVASGLTQTGVVTLAKSAM